MIIFAFLKLLFFSLIDVVVKLITFFILPFAYFLRPLIIFRSSDEHNWYLYEVKRINGWRILIWLWFDDSVWASTHGRDWDFYGVPKYLRWSDFLSTWWWCGVRNSANNLYHLLTVGEMENVIWHYGNSQMYLELRKYPRGIFPFIEAKDCYGNRIYWGWKKNGKFSNLSFRR